MILLKVVDKGEGSGHGRFGPQIGQKNLRELRNEEGAINDSEVLDTLRRRPGLRKADDSFKVKDIADALEYIKRVKIREKLASRIKDLGKLIGWQKEQFTQFENEINKTPMSRKGEKLKERLVDGGGEKGGNAKESDHKNPRPETKNVEKEQGSEIDKAVKGNGVQKEREKEVNGEQKHNNEKIRFIDVNGNEVGGYVTTEDDMEDTRDTDNDNEAALMHQADLQDAKADLIRAKHEEAWKRKVKEIDRMVVMVSPEEEEARKKREKAMRQKQHEIEQQKQRDLEIVMQRKLRERQEKEKEEEQKQNRVAEEKAKRLEGKTNKDYYHIHGVVPVPFDVDYNAFSPLEITAQRGKLSLHRVCISRVLNRVVLQSEQF
jgi:hypothetical protein